MYSEYIQHLRYKLQKRVRRLNSIEHVVFHFALQQFWGFLLSYPLFLGILEDLAMRCPAAEAEAEKTVSQHLPSVFDTELENAALAYFVISKCVASPPHLTEARIGLAYNNQSKYSEGVETFRSLFLEPLYEYIDEHLDDQRAILGLLRRYKHKCEWFERDQLFRKWKSETSRGEKQLALHLYEYLYDQGLQFSIEGWSVSGEADLVKSQTGEEPLIADAKIFNPDKGKDKLYIASGFRQVYQYTLDYNEPFGYLIIFNTSGKDIKFTLRGKEQATPFICHNNKTIFFLTIDIFPYEQSASKRGPLNTLEITEEYLVRIIEEPKSFSTVDDIS